MSQRVYELNSALLVALKREDVATYNRLCPKFAEQLRQQKFLAAKREKDYTAVANGHAHSEAEANESAITDMLVKEMSKTKFLGVISADDVNADNYFNLFNLTTRGLDEEAGTLTRRYEVYNNSPLDAGATPANIAIAGAGTIIAAGHLYVQYRHSKDREDLLNLHKVDKRLRKMKRALTGNLAPTQSNSEQLARSIDADVGSEQPLAQTELSEEDKAFIVACVRKAILLKQLSDQLHGTDAYWPLPTIKVKGKKLKAGIVFVKIQPVSDSAPVSEEDVSEQKEPASSEASSGASSDSEDMRSVTAQSMESIDAPAKLNLTVTAEAAKPSEKTWKDKIIDTASLLWNFTCIYGMMYWLIWFSIWRITGQTLGPASNPVAIVLAFSIPTIFALGYVVWKARTGRGMVERLKEKSQCEDAARATLQYYRELELAKEVKEKYSKLPHRSNAHHTFATLEARIERLNQMFKLTNKNDEQHFVPVKAKIAAKAKKRKEQVKGIFARIRGQAAVVQTSGFKKFLGVVSGFSFGAIITGIGVWVITDFLQIAFQSFNPTWAMFTVGAAFNLPLILTAMTIVLAVGVIMGIQRYRQYSQEHQNLITQINKTENKLADNRYVKCEDDFAKYAAEIKQQEKALKAMRTTITALIKHYEDKNNINKVTQLRALLIKAQAIPYPKFDGRRGKAFGVFAYEDDGYARTGYDLPTRGAGIRSVFNKCCGGLIALIDGFGSGSLLSNFVLISYFLVPALLFLALGAQVTLPFVLIGTAVGIGMAIFKCVRYFHTDQQGRDARLADNLVARAAQLEGEYEGINAQNDYVFSELNKIVDKDVRTPLMPSEYSPDDPELLNEGYGRVFTAAVPVASNSAAAPKSSPSVERSGRHLLMPATAPWQPTELLLLPDTGKKPANGNSAK